MALFVLRKYACPRITEALEKRQRAIEESIDDRRARRARRPTSCSRSTASGCARRAPRPRRSSPARARPARRTSASRVEEARAKREELLEQTRRDIEAETRRAIQEIRREVADLTVLATEKVTRKTLDDDDQQRLVEEALGELDFTAARRGSTDS